MQVSTARRKPMPRARPGPWLHALVWLLFCAAMVAIGLYFSPGVGLAFDATELPSARPSKTLPVADTADHAVPMAATVLLPHEPQDAPVVWAPKL